MKDAAELIKAFAALISSLAWPVVTGLIVFLLRAQFKEIVAKIPAALDRMQSIKVGMVETQLRDLADREILNSGDAGLVTGEQVHVAAELSRRAIDIGKDQLVSQMDRLATEYDIIRKTQRGGSTRTQMMTRIIVQMRALGPSIISSIGRYKDASSPGKRLAAVAMMQMQPQKADVEWLQERFASDSPFIFYHAALALQNLVALPDEVIRRRAIDTARLCADIVWGFDGAPDRNTLQVLDGIIS